MNLCTDPWKDHRGGSFCWTAWN